MIVARFSACGALLMQFDYPGLPEFGRCEGTRCHIDQWVQWGQCDCGGADNTKGLHLPRGGENPALKRSHGVVVGGDGPAEAAAKALDVPAHGGKPLVKLEP